MVECRVCLEEYQEGDLELHRQMCVLRLMFRCSLCAEDFVSKEGLWNHLDLHEIVDESKELHYQEIKSKHKLLQCVLCNDQRAYSESPYWKHVHDIHDGFFLRCSDCGENFRSEELKNDHISSRCEARNQTVTSDLIGLSQHSRDNTNTANNVDINISDKEAGLPTSNTAKSQSCGTPSSSDTCGTPSSSKAALVRYLMAKKSCREGRCPHCRRVFQVDEYQVHVSLCEKRPFPCDFCPMKFDTAVLLKAHNKYSHHQRILEAEKRKRNQVKKIKGKTDTADKSAQLLAENSTSESSGTSNTKCSHCDRECVNASYLRKHILHCHQPTTCNICGITFDTYFKVRHHKTMKHTKPKYECAKCSRKFHFEGVYERHLKTCSRLSKKSSEELLLEEWSVRKAAAENSPSEASCAVCSLCGIVEASPDSLARHILMHHDPVACGICGRTLSSLAEARHHTQMMHKRSKAKCLHCLTQFSSRGRLEQHIPLCQDKKVPCELCGKMFRDKVAVHHHMRKMCRKRSIEQEQKRTTTSLGDGTDSCSAIKKISSFLVESGLSQTKCYHCGEECSHPGYLNQHLQTCHELTRCDICGITVIGISRINNHKIKCHLKPKHECLNCGEKFHVKKTYIDHCIACERKLYSCKLCGRTFKQMQAVKRHNVRHHPDKSNLEHIQIVQDSTQVQSNDLNMELTEEETSTSERDDQEQSTANLSTEDDVSNISSNGCPLASFGDAESMDSTSERLDVSERTSQLLVDNLSNRSYSCNICGIALRTYSQVSYHKRRKHTEGKLQCPLCSRKFYYQRKLEEHVGCCASLKFSCDLCGQKYNAPSRVENHKKEAHQDNRSLEIVNIKGTDCNEERKQTIVEKMDTAEDMTSCIICRSTFDSTHELLNHKLTCPPPRKEHNESQLGMEEIVMRRDVMEAQTNSTIVTQGENIELKLEIKVEDTTLQEQEY